MFDTDDVDEAKRMLPIYKRAVDLLETVSGKKTEQAEQELVDGVLPCPFCGDSQPTVFEGSTFRWRVAVCNNCGAYAPEVRHDTLAEDQKQAGIESDAAAITAWNTRAAPVELVEQEPVAEAIAAEARLHRAVRAVASQAGESAEDTIEWLCNGGMAQLFECHFSGKNRESLCEDEGCPHRGVPHICIEKQAEQEPVAWLADGQLFYTKDVASIEPLIPLYTHPVRTKDLTDDEIYEAVENIIFDENFDINIARAVIKKFKEKQNG